MNIAAKPARHRQSWSQEDLNYLMDYYGLVPVKKLAKRLKRSEAAICRIATKKLGRHMTDNFYTGWELARALGLNSIGKIVRWVGKGWLEGTKAPAARGHFKLWCFTEKAVVDCLRQRPWLVASKMRVCRTSLWRNSEYGIFLLSDDRSSVLNLKSMPPHHFRSVVREEWEKDPWYTGKQAAPLIGVSHEKTVRRYINNGQLAAEKTPRKAYIRGSSIKAFLENVRDFRRKRKSSSMQEHLISLGRPTRVAITWVIRCPHCGDMVKLIVPPMLTGPQVRDLFLKEHTDGHCTHGLGEP